MTAVAIVVLVKNPDDPEKGKIYFHAVDDYLTREEKLTQLVKAESISKIDWQKIRPDKHGDWLNQRDDSYSCFMRLDGKKTLEHAIFKNYSRGLATAKDIWCYNFSKQAETKNISKLISFYKEQKDAFQKEKQKLNIEEQKKFRAEDFVTYDPSQIAWSERLLTDCARGEEIKFEEKSLSRSVYRPFVPSWVYFHPKLNDRVYQMPKLFPTAAAENLVICINQGAKATDGFIALMTNQIADLHFNGDSQCFPRFIYNTSDNSKKEGSDLFNLTEENSKTAASGGFIKEDAVTEEALEHFREAYPENAISKDDLFYYIYGILHSPDYRTKYANNLSKELPRIPRVATFEQFKAFSEAGRKLADLHVNFEKQPRYSGVNIQMQPGASFHVTQMKWGKIKGKTGNAAKDKTRLIYNSDITIENIPLEAQEYVVNKKSALDWIVERCCVKVDKDSGIVNDFNKYGEEMGDTTYPYDLFLKVITVSLETVKIVKNIPALEIHPLDREGD